MVRVGKQDNVIMEQETLKLRKALVHYEECVDVCAAEHILVEALTNIVNKCNKLAEVATKVMDSL